MTIKEYKEKFVELFEKMQKEHGEVSIVFIHQDKRNDYYATGDGVWVKCDINF